VSGVVGNKADLSLSFIVSGADRLARSAAAAAGAGPAGASPRLLLPTAASLEVTLSPESGGTAIAADPVQIAVGADTVPVSLSDVPYGTYTIRAEAKDGSGVVRFTQTSSLSVGDPALSSTLNLVPTGQAGAPIEATTLHDIDIAELPSGEARTWLVAPGSRLLAARSIFLSGLGSEVRVYLQASDGTLVSDTLGTVTCLSTVSVPVGEPAYLTVYNGAAGAQPASRAFPGPAMVEVPAGAFQRDAASADNVSHVSAFSMADLEVTRELYLAVMGEDPSAKAYSSGTSDPVQYVNWYHAIAFCNKLSLMEGLTPVYTVTVGGSPLNWAATVTIPAVNDVDWNSAVADQTANGYRLPTEMEWMWSAMGATRDSRLGDIVDGINRNGRTKGYGGSIEANDGTVQIGSFAWHQANSENKTHPAGSRQPNELTLYDLSGNVREWLWDWYAPSYPAGAIIDYQGAASSEQRVYRGGGFTDGVVPCSINSQNNTYPHERFGQLGFRVARGVLPTFAIAYHANGATSGTVPAATIYLSSGQVSIALANTGSLKGAFIHSSVYQQFDGWNTKADGTGTMNVPGDSILVSSDINLFARYTSVGCQGPAGGLIFYDRGSYTVGDPYGDWRYMEAAPQSGETSVGWGPSVAVSGTSSAMGDGLANTAVAVAWLSTQGSTGMSAQYCDAYTYDGCSDWFLPSKDELYEMYSGLHLNGLGGFSDT